MRLSQRRLSHMRLSCYSRGGCPVISRKMILGEFIPVNIVPMGLIFYR